jgi:hypothetical protein
VGSKIDNAAAFARGAVRTKRLADKSFMPMTVVVRETDTDAGYLMCSQVAPKQCVLVQKGMELGIQRLR